MRWQENRAKLGDKDAQETENHWRQSSEKKDAESYARENKLLEEISLLKEKVSAFIA